MISLSTSSIMPSCCRLPNKVEYTDHMPDISYSFSGPRDARKFPVFPWGSWALFLGPTQGHTPMAPRSDQLYLFAHHYPLPPQTHTDQTTLVAVGCVISVCCSPVRALGCNVPLIRFSILALYIVWLFISYASPLILFFFTSSLLISSLIYLFL